MKAYIAHVSRAHLVHLAAAELIISDALHGAPRIAAHYSGGVWLEAVGPASWRRLVSGYQSTAMFLVCLLLPNWVNASNVEIA
jgi:hypothetical protein